MVLLGKVSVKKGFHGTPTMRIAVNLFFVQKISEAFYGFLHIVVSDTVFVSKIV